MRFLVDQPVSPIVAAWLAGRGHDAVHVRDRGMSRSTDEQIVALAVAEQRVIVTSDLDYPRIIALAGVSRPGLVLFRAGNISDREMLALLQRVLTEVPAERLPGSVVVIDEHSIRVATLPLR